MTETLRSLQPEETRRAFEGLHQSFDDLSRQTGILAPRRLRLIGLGLQSQAREVQSLSADKQVALAEMRAFVARLRTWSRESYSGWIPALQLDMTPSRAAFEAGLPSFHALGYESWAQVALSADDESARIEEEDARNGFDADGYNESAVEIPPNDPDAELGDLSADVVAATGPLDVWPPSVESARMALQQDPSRFVRWARTARWIRPFVNDTERWARVMGRLRWLAQEVVGGSEFSRVLDPSTRPSTTWAESLGRNPVRSWLKTLWRDTRVAGTANAVASWLEEALGSLPVDDVAQIVRPKAGEVLALQPTAVFASRAKRRHLVEVQRRLHGMQPDSSMALAAVEPPVDLAEARRRNDRKRDPIREAMAALRPFTAGKRVVVVGNRRNQVVLDALARDLGFSAVCGNDGRNLDAVVEKIANRTVDFVLVSVFVGHSTSWKLGSAARSSGVKYICVGRGGVQACARAIAARCGQLMAA